MSVPKGTTPTFVLTFEDIDLTTASHVYVTFKGAGGKVTKTDDDLTVDATSISVYLTQEETLILSNGAVAIQANWTFEDGSRAASEIVKYTLTDNLLSRVVE